MKLTVKQAKEEARKAGIDFRKTFKNQTPSAKKALSKIAEKEGYKENGKKIAKEITGKKFVFKAENFFAYLSVRKG